MTHGPVVLTAQLVLQAGFGVYCLLLVSAETPAKDSTGLVLYCLNVFVFLINCGLEMQFFPCFFIKLMVVKSNYFSIW